MCTSNAWIATCGADTRIRPSLLPGYVRLPVFEDQLRLAAREVQKHLCEVAICPGEPWPCVRSRVVNVDRLVNEAQSVRVLP